MEEMEREHRNRDGDRGLAAGPVVMGRRLMKVGRRRVGMERVVGRGYLSRLRRIESREAAGCIEMSKEEKGTNSVYCFLTRAWSLGSGLGIGSAS
jgi:hypothetical protein